MPRWIAPLGHAVEEARPYGSTTAPGPPATGLVPCNVAFLPVVLVHGFRRPLPATRPERHERRGPARQRSPIRVP